MNIVRDFALVPSGGSYRVIFQIPSLMFLEKHGIYPEGVVAISGGVPNVLEYLLGRAHNLPDIWCNEIDHKKLFGLDLYGLVVKPLRKGRLPFVGAPSILREPKFVENIIDREVSQGGGFEAILDSPVQLWVGVMNLREGKLEWVSNKDEGMTPEYFRQKCFESMRIAVFFPALNDCVDAGLITNCPIPKAIQSGFSRIVALNALPSRLPPLAGFEMWPDVRLRHDDIIHIEEVARHEKLTEQINHDLAMLESIKKYFLVRVSLAASRKLRNLFDNFSFLAKRRIELCVLQPSHDLAIFRRIGRHYGSPSLAARQELLFDGERAVLETLVPYLEKQSIFSVKKAV